MNENLQSYEKLWWQQSNNCFADYFYIIPLGIMRYMTHGFFEILAYFIGGLAGGIVSIALIKHNLQENRVLIDSLDLIRIIDLSSCMFELSKRP